MGDPPTTPELSWGDAWISLFWVLGLLLVNAFFVAVEFSLVSARRSRIVQLASEGHKQAALVQKAQDHLERSLSTTQLGITVASVLLGWISATQVARVLSVGMAGLPWLAGVDRDLLHNLMVVLTFIGVTYLQIVWGELLPKTLAIVYAEPIALQLAWLNDWVRRLLNPFVELPRFSSRLILKILRVPIPDSTSLYNTPTAEELQLLIASSGESGGIEAEERELLSNVFEFGETVASEVMIPRTSIAAVPETATVQDVLLQVAESRHSRYLVFGDSLDDIRGLIDIKQLVAELAKGNLQLESQFTDWIQKAHFEHENKLIAELLPEMQQQRRAMVVIVDEFGGTAGLVTIKDLVEEIVGNLSDNPELGDAEADVQVIDENTVIIQAQMDVEEASEKLDLDLPVHDDYQTLGGFLIYQMQKIPQVGEKLIYENVEFQVIRIEGPRLDRIQVTKLSTLFNSTHSDNITLNGTPPTN